MPRAAAGQIACRQLRPCLGRMPFLLSLVLPLALVATGCSSGSPSVERPAAPAERLDLEGIVAKRKVDPYSADITWYKIKEPGVHPRRR